MFTQKHTKKSNLKRSHTIKKLYNSGKLMGFRSPKGKIAARLPRVSFWKGKKLPYTVWNKGKRGLQTSPIKGLKLPERSGSKSGCWKGGITPLRQKIKSTREWKNWIKKIMKRDNYKCQECGEKNNKLHVHHIKSYAQIREENNILTVEDAIKYKELWNIRNGIVLCIKCHKNTDTYLSKNNRKLNK